MKFRKPERNLNGFTLIETVIALTILSIVAAMIFSLLYNNLRFFCSSDAAKEQASLRMTAYKLTDRFRNISFVDLDNHTFLSTSEIESVSATDYFVFLTTSGVREGSERKISTLSDSEVTDVSFNLRQSDDRYFLGISLQGKTSTYSTEVLLNNILDISQIGSSGLGSGFRSVQFNFPPVTQ